MKNRYWSVKPHCHSPHRQNGRLIAWFAVLLTALVFGGLIFMIWMDDPVFQEQDADLTAGISTQARLGGKRDYASDSALRQEGTDGSMLSVVEEGGGNGNRSSYPGSGTTTIPGSHSFKSGVNGLARGVSERPASGLDLQAAGSQSAGPANRPDEFPDNEPTEYFSISGWVKNQSGALIPGIRLEATAQRIFNSTDGAGSRLSTPILATRSDASGYYSFTELADGEYTIRSQATEVYSGASILVRAGVDSADLLLVEQPKEIEVYGVVTSTRGEALGNVLVKPINQPNRVTVTDSDGNYALWATLGGRSRVTTLRYLRDGYQEQRQSIHMESAQGRESIRIDTSLEPSTGFVQVSGEVFSGKGHPLPDTTVSLSSARLKRHYQVSSDEYGRFQFSSVEIGEDYRIRAYRSDAYREYNDWDLVLTSNWVDLHIVLESLGLGSLEGQMVNVEGKPVPRFSLWLRSIDTPSYPRQLVTGDGEGIFSLSEVPAGNLKLETPISPYLAIDGIQLPQGGHLVIEPVIDWGDHVLYGEVVGTRGNPVPQARILLSWRHDNGGLLSRSSRSATSDANGYFLFTRLGSGLHQLHVTASGFVDGQFDHTIGFDKDEIKVTLEAEN